MGEKAKRALMGCGASALAAIPGAFLGIIIGVVLERARDLFPLPAKQDPFYPISTAVIYTCYVIYLAFFAIVGAVLGSVIGAAFGLSLRVTAEKQTPSKLTVDDP